MYRAAKKVWEAVAMVLAGMTHGIATNRLRD
jgi:hypothetical protein